MQHVCKLLCFWLLCIGASANGQAASPPLLSDPLPPNAATTLAPRVPPPTVEPIPLTEVTSQAKTVSTSLRNIEVDLSMDRVTGTLESELRVLNREIDPRLEEGSKILAASPTVEMLQNLEAGWQQIHENLASWIQDLTRRQTFLDTEKARLDQLEARWEPTLQLAEDSQTTSPVLQRVETVVVAIKKTERSVIQRLARVSDLQSRIVEQNARVSEMLYSLHQARDDVFHRLLLRDSAPLWSVALRTQAGQNLVAESRVSFVAQLTALQAYAERKSGAFVGHTLLIIVLIIGFYWVRERIQALVVEAPLLEHAALVFASPLSTAIVLSICGSGLFYGQAPRLLWAILGASALIPTIFILRRLIEPQLYPILNGLVVFYFLDQLREIAAASPILSRLLFLGEFLGGLLFIARLIYLARRSSRDHDHIWKIIWTGARISLSVSSVAVLANIVGFVNLGNYLGNTVLRCADLAAILYAATQILDGLTMVALHIRPLIFLDIVRRHGRTIQGYALLFFQWGAFVLWLRFLVAQLGLHTVLWDTLQKVLNADLVIGAVHLSPGHILAFVATVWSAFLFSKFVRILLDEDFYPRVQLGHGIPYAMSTLLHYIILLVGFYVAVAALGFDMTRFTILAGAFGVGSGFGLQNIVNNFVSGLVLLFERPIKVGDVIQMDADEGTVERIGIRASIIRVANGSEIIVPNGKMISERVTNWTFSNQQRSIVLPVQVASASDPRRVIELLQAVAAEHPSITRSPLPEAFFVRFSPGALDFELQAWTTDYREWERIRSDLATAIHTAFQKENISIP